VLHERGIPQWKDYVLQDYENAAELPKEGGVFRLKVQVPEGTVATVCVPVAEHGLKAVRAQGGGVWPGVAPAVPGLQAVEGPAGHASFVVQPGVWEFEAR
jgi:hypothetical protein